MTNHQDKELSGEIFDYLDEELSAIDCRYRGDPSYDHDAYWMKEKVQKLIAEARAIFSTSPQLPVAQMSGYRLIDPDDIRNIVEDLQKGIISANAVLTLKDWLSDACVVASHPSNAEKS